MKYTGLLGNNISYSKSPDIHNKYYYENNIPLRYKIFDIKEEELPYFIKNLYKKNIVGFNVTIPYKTKILEYIEKLEHPADKIGAVNTVVALKNKLIGFNTDYYGFIESLKIRNIELKEKNSLIIGNGGSALCIYYALMDIGCKNIDALCRNKYKNKEKFRKIRYFHNFHNDIEYEQYDIIINCTPLGGVNYIKSIPIDLEKVKLKKDVLIYDLNYKPQETLFISQGKKMGITCINGEDMLKFQAYKSIDIWKIYMLNGEDKKVGKFK